MSGATALKKINARVKQLKKRHPNAKRSTLQKQAGKEFKAGKLKKKKKAAPRKKVVHHRKKRRVVAKKVHRRRKAVVHHRKRRRSVTGIKRRRVVHHVIRKRRRVSGMGKSGKLLLIGAVAVGAYLLLRPKAPQTVYIPTGSTYRDSSAQNIIAIAQAAGIVGAQLTKLIQQINSATDSQVQALSTAATTAPASLGDDTTVQQILANSGTAIARIMG